MSRITVRAACPWRHFFVSVSLIPSFLCPVLLPQVAGCCVALHGCWNGIAHKADVCLSFTPNSAMSCRTLKVMRMGAYVSAVGNVLQSDLNVDTLTHIYIYTLVISVSIARQLTGCITSEEIYIQIQVQKRTIKIHSCESNQFCWCKSKNKPVSTVDVQKRN